VFDVILFLNLSRCSSWHDEFSIYLNLFNKVRRFNRILTSEGKSLRRFFVLNEFVLLEIIVPF
jgi:hypothetical protein